MALVPGSPEWQKANNVRPNGRGGWTSNDQLGDGSFVRQGLIPLAAVLGGGALASAMGPAGAAGASGAAGGAAPAAPSAAGVNSVPWWKRIFGGGGGGNDSDILERILGGWLPLGLAGGATLMGLRNQTPPAENQLKGMLDIAQRRVEGAEPLYQALNAMAMQDADVVNRRRAASEPLFNAMAAQAQAQMPRYTREG